MKGQAPRIRAQNPIYFEVCQDSPVLNMAWLSVSLIIYQLITLRETQAAEVLWVNSSFDFVHPVELPNFTCDQIVYPVAGVVFGLYSPYIIALAMALIGCGIFIITNGYGMDFVKKTFYRWARIFLNYHCDISADGFWPWNREDEECPKWLKLAGFLGPPTVGGLFGFVIGLPYNVPCGSNVGFGAYSHQYYGLILFGILVTCFVVVFAILYCNRRAGEDSAIGTVFGRLSWPEGWNF